MRTEVESVDLAAVRPRADPRRRDAERGVVRRPRPGPGAVPGRPHCRASTCMALRRPDPRRRQCSAARGRRTLAEAGVVVGGGYIGIEMAEAWCTATRGGRGRQGRQPMATLDPAMGALVHEAWRAMGSTCGPGPRHRVEGDAGGRVRGVATEGEVLRRTGHPGSRGRPETTLAAGAGLPLGPSGGLRTDLRMRVAGHEHVWSGGDCVESATSLVRDFVHVALGTHANKQGRVIGTNVGGGYATFPGVVARRCEGLRPRNRPERLGERGGAPRRLRGRRRPRASRRPCGYFPDSSPITVRLIAERRTAGSSGPDRRTQRGAAKRIDTLAVALGTG